MSPIYPCPNSETQLLSLRFKLHSSVSILTYNITSFSLYKFDQTCSMFIQDTELIELPITRHTGYGPHGQANVYLICDIIKTCHIRVCYK